MWPRCLNKVDVRQEKVNLKKVNNNTKSRISKYIQVNTVKRESLIGNTGVVHFLQQQNISLNEWNRQPCP